MASIMDDTHIDQPVLRAGAAGQCCPGHWTIEKSVAQRHETTPFPTKNGCPLFRRQSDFKFRGLSGIILFSRTTLSFLVIASRLEKARKPFGNYTNRSSFVAD